MLPHVERLRGWTGGKYIIYLSCGYHRVFKIVRLKKGESKLIMYKIQYMDNFEVEICCIF